jgi:TonB family protein
MPQLSRHRASLLSKVLTLVICGAAILPRANAFQTQQQLESNDTGHKIKTRVAPEYPELARRLQLQGTARVQFTITPEGAVKDVHELGGNPVLVDALIRAVKQWKYEPSAKETIVEVKATFSR